MHNRIPFGNGNRSVDQAIPDGKGGFTHSRVAAGENGGWQRWNLNADGTAFYGYKPSADSGMAGNDYDAGTPTTWRPDRSYLTTADYQGIQTPTLDAAGNIIAVDIAYPNRYGLYDNHHVDQYDNVTISRAVPDGKGGITSSFIGQLDSNGEGWRIDDLGDRWDVGKDLLGRPVEGRTETTGEGTHIYYRDHRGVVFDSFLGNSDNEAYTDERVYDDLGRLVSITRRLRDGTEITFAPDLTIKEYRGPRDRRDIVEKAVDGVVGVGSSLRSWGSDFAQIFDFSTGLHAAANPLDPAARAAAAQQQARANSAVSNAAALPVDIVVDSAGTVGSWFQHTYGGAFWGITADPFSASGQTRMHGAQEYMDKAPGTAEALLAATTFLFPEVGAPARVGATAARRAAAEAAAAATHRPGTIAALGTETIASSPQRLTTAELSRAGATRLPAGGTPFTSATSTVIPNSGIITFDVMRSGTRAVTSADLPLLAQAQAPSRAIEGATAFDPRQLSDGTYTLARSGRTVGITSGTSERQLVAAGRTVGDSTADHRFAVVLRERPLRSERVRSSAAPHSAEGDAVPASRRFSFRRFFSGSASAGERRSSVAPGDEVHTFYHGTTQAGADSIRREGIRIIDGGTGATDFGPGFYTSRDLETAAKWAQVAANRSREAPEIVKFEVRSSEFENLTRRTFADTSDWSAFVSYMRSPADARMHDFDVVEGPVLSNLRSFRRGEAPVGTEQQTSWHSQHAVDLLSRRIVKGW
ncbi:DUF3990 domain-containing protein [Nocardia jiangsuensis]|uniref:DUF3990 domain-containing protein n=1 Tax=Nocardia jiangsuensis TaxID=1691563 RepID=A0ABV8DY88_9NOCA